MSRHQSGPTPEDGLRKRTNVGAVLSAVVGLAWTALAALLLLASLISGPAAARIAAALLFIASAALALPWTASRLRRWVPLLRPTPMPPLGAIVAMIAGLIVIVPSADRAEPDQTEVAEEPSEPTPPPEELIASASALLDEGQHEEALELLARLPRDVRSSSEVVELQGSARRREATEQFIGQMEGQYLEPLEEAHAPGDDEDIAVIWNTTALFENMARDLEAASNRDMDERGREALARYRSELSARQAQLFPQLRRAWVAKIRHGFWLQDIEVEVSGAQAGTVTWTGALFAANANIDTAQRGFRTNLQRLRISRSQYRWYEYGERTYYDMEPPSDGAIGYWDNGRFHPVE